MTTPTPINPPRNSQRQRGAAILIMTLILMLGLITLFTFRMDRRAPELEADRKTAMALAQAKENLLGRAAWGNRPNGVGADDPGTLSCPDIDNDGDADTDPSGDCKALPGGQTEVGRFPGKTLRTGELVDSTGQALWYMLSPNFVDMGKSILPSVSGSISVNGSAPIYVAVIFAPGSPLPGQSRSTDPNDLVQFLESYVNPSTVNTSLPGVPGNDRVIAITAEEIRTVATQRIAGELVKYLPVPYPSNQNWFPNAGEWVGAAGHWTGWLAATTYDSSGPKLTFAGCAGAVYNISWDSTLNKSVVQRSGHC